jgi:hypothetical protein
MAVHTIAERGLKKMTKPRKHGVAFRLSRCHIRGEARMTNGFAALNRKLLNRSTGNPM